MDVEKLSDLYRGAFEDYVAAADDSGRERSREEPFLDVSLEVERQGEEIVVCIFVNFFKDL